MIDITCPWDAAYLLVFSENVPPLLYYSHFISIAAALCASAYIVWRSYHELSARLLFALCGLFSIWAILDVILWATNSPQVVVFWWSFVVLIEVLIYACSFYLSYYFLRRKLPTVLLNISTFLLLIPIIAYFATSHNVAGVYIADCVAAEGWVAEYYVYVVELLFVLGIMVTGFQSFRVLRGVERQKAILFISGIIVFLLSLASSNILGSLTEDWDVAQYGLMGMPVFIGMLLYLVVRFGAFNIKVLAVQALVLTLWVLISSLLFVVRTNASRVVAIITLMVVVISGLMLVRAVNREIMSREKGEQLARYLATANARLRALDQQKTEFVSIASHQLRAPIAAITGYSSLMVEGSYGPLPDNLREPLVRMFESGKRIAIMVDDFLNVSRMEQGRMSYVMLPIDMSKLVTDAADEVMLIAKNNGISLKVMVPKASIQATVMGDESKLKHVFSNLIDNAVKYTKKGSVIVKLYLSENKSSVLVSVQDTGIGIAAEEIPALFSKFTRASNANTATVSGTGLGLYIAKEIVRAHKGWIHVTSPGLNKGSTFTVELPCVSATTESAKIAK